MIISSIHKFQEQNFFAILYLLTALATASILKYLKIFTTRPVALPLIPKLAPSNALGGASWGRGYVYPLLMQVG